MANEAKDNFETFYQQNASRLIAYTAYQVGSLDEARDIVQDSFIALWRRWDEVQQPGAYLFTSCKHAIRDHYRQRAREWRHEASALDMEEPTVDGLATIAGVDTLLLIKDLSSELKSDDAQLLALILSEHNTAEISRALGIGVDTATRRVSRLRKVLGDLMAAEPADEEGSANSLETEQVSRALKVLTKRQRAIFVRRAHGMKPAQIAEKLDTNEGNVGVMTHKAGTKIADALGLKSPFEALAYVREHISPDEKADL